MFRFRLAVAFAALLAAAALSTSASAAVLPLGFTETTVWGGLGNPTVVRFAPDGRVFVASKSGIINTFDGITDTTPTQFADLRTRVHDFWDRGLLGMAVDPNYTAGRPYVYVLYAYDKAPNSTQQPRWGDACATPPGATADGCVITGRLSRLSATGAETVLIEDFCQQYPSHSVGSVDVGPDGMLYLSSGDGASFNWADYGQDGNPVNPCGDPPGGTLTPPTSQGGALRSQSFRRPSTQTASLDGAILRVNPDTGAAAAGNPRSPTPTRSGGGSSPTASATRSASRSAPAPARSGRATSAGTRGRRSTARRTSPRSATTAGPATRARRGWAPTTR